MLSKFLLAVFSFGIVVSAASAAEPRDGLYHGSYVVPALAELAPVSSFKTTFKVGHDAAGKLTLSYRLPEEVVGSEPVPIDLVEVDGEPMSGFTKLAGPRNHEASCRVLSDSLVCFVLYPELRTDPIEIHQLLVKKGLGDILNRDKLAQLFSADPKGVVYCPLK
jgi:hypothetical protein